MEFVNRGLTDGLPALEFKVCHGRARTKPIDEFERTQPPEKDEEHEMSLEQELKSIWDKYETQRAAERDAAKTRADAERELAELNAKRIKAGLETASVYQDHTRMLQAQPVWIGTNGQQKTWRSEMESEMMVAIRKAFG
jgi:hypothetical protein